MTPAQFWSLIETTRIESDQDATLEALEEALSKMDASEIVDFDRHLGTAFAESYAWNLWGAAYLIHGGCSDDGFDYFREWLILQGKTVFEKALKDPDTLADLPEASEYAECQELLSIADSAYESVTGKDMPHQTRPPQPELGEGWDFDDEDEMQSRYPRLFTRFADN